MVHMHATVLYSESIIVFFVIVDLIYYELAVVMMRHTMMGLGEV